MLETIYAQALWRAIEEGETSHTAVQGLKDALERRGRLAILPRVARVFKRIAERENKRNALTLTTAHSGVARAKKEAKEVLAALHIDAEDIAMKEDATLIGGWRLEGKESLYDASFKKYLLSIYNRTIQS